MSSKGFVDYRVSATVKFGGSLLKDPGTCQGALDALSKGATDGHRLLVVPGGGPTDDTIEVLHSRHALHPNTHHYACALAQDQTGLMLCDPLWRSRLSWCSTLESARHIMDDGQVAVLLPSQLIRSLDPFERSWDITSDAIAVYFSWLVQARRTIILTNIDGIYPPGKVGERDALIATIAASDLEALGNTAVDPCTPSYLQSKQMNCWVLNGGHPTRLLALLADGTPVGTLTKGKS